MLKFLRYLFYVMGKALSEELSCPCDRSCFCTSVLAASTTGMLLRGPIYFPLKAAVVFGIRGPISDQTAYTFNAEIANYTEQNRT